MSLRSRIFVTCQYALTLVASGPARLRMLSTRWKNTPFTTASAGDRQERAGTGGATPLALGEAVSRRLQLWEERCAEKLRESTAGGVSAGHATGRHLFLGGIRPKGSALVAPELEKWLPHNLPKRRPSLRKDVKDVKNENWWQHLIREAGTVGSPSSETTWRPSFILRTASSSRPAAPTPDLLPLPTGVGFLPGFEHVKEKVWLRSAVDAINELGGRVLPSRGTPNVVQRLALVGVTSEFASPGRGHSRSGPGSWLCRRQATGKPALFKHGLVSLPRVQAG